MRFAHLGDTHLGRAYPTAQRISSFNQAFKLVIDNVLREELDFVIHTGDFFDKYNPWPSVVKFATKQLFRLQEKNIPVFIVRGNHDGAFDIQGLRRGSSIELTNHPLAENIHFIDPLFDRATNIKTVGYRDFNDFRIHGLGYYSTETSKYLENYVKPNLSEEAVNILLLHSFVNGYTLNPTGEPVVNLQDLDMPLLRYVAVGHDHTMLKPITLKNGTVVACSGSTELWDFRESGYKGFYLIDIENTVTVEPVFIETGQLMTTIVIDSASPKPPEWYVKQAKAELKKIVNSTDKELIVRVNMIGPLLDGSLIDIPLGDLDLFALEYKKKGRLLYFEIIPQQLQFEANHISILLERFDVKQFLEQIISDSVLVKDVYSVYQKANELLADDSNLTRNRNLKKEAFDLLLEEIVKHWGA